MPFYVSKMNSISKINYSLFKSLKWNGRNHWVYTLSFLFFGFVGTSFSGVNQHSIQVNCIFSGGILSYRGWIISTLNKKIASNICFIIEPQNQAKWSGWMLSRHSKCQRKKSLNKMLMQHIQLQYMQQILFTVLLFVFILFLVAIPFFLETLNHKLLKRIRKNSREFILCYMKLSGSKVKARSDDETWFK